MAGVSSVMWARWRGHGCQIKVTSCRGLCIMSHTSMYDIDCGLKCTYLQLLKIVCLWSQMLNLQKFTKSQNKWGEAYLHLYYNSSRTYALTPLYLVVLCTFWLVYHLLSCLNDLVSLVTTHIRVCESHTRIIVNKLGPTTLVDTNKLMQVGCLIPGRFSW